MQWKDKAYNLYFNEHKSINEISKIVGRSRQSVSAFLNAQNNISDEKQNRKTLSGIKRKKDNLENMRKVRKQRRNKVVENALLKRQHVIDVNVLSRERHFNYV